jgi:hypothetical protein
LSVDNEGLIRLRDVRIVGAIAQAGAKIVA